MRNMILGGIGLGWMSSWLFVVPAAALDFSGGTGELHDPYHIATAEQLLTLGEDPNLSDKHFELIADINLSRWTFSTAPIERFSGHFNGNGYRILNLSSEGSRCPGLFGTLANTAMVEDLGIVDAIVQVESSDCGLLVGENLGTITRCESSGSIAGKWRVGGLVGYNRGSVSQCYSMATVGGESESSGGLVGFNEGDISQCHSTGSVSGGGSMPTGGLVGNNEGVISQSYSTALVNGGTCVGGLAGRNVGDILESYSTGSVRGGTSAGGFVGLNYGAIFQSYSKGSVSGTIRVGGFVGNNRASIFQSYSTGSVSGNREIGGFIGYHYESVAVVDCVWDVEGSGQTRSVGGIGLSHEEMKHANWYALNGWANDPAWVIADGIDTPQLTWENVPGQVIGRPTSPFAGAGTSADPFRIENTQDFIRVNKSPVLWDRHFVLATDIDLADYPFGLSVIHRFSGSFDGRGHRIMNLTIDGLSSLGLVGQLTDTGSIQDLNIVGANIVGTGEYVGMLVGVNEGTIAACHSCGSVYGDEMVGGLVGNNKGIISQSFNIGSVLGRKYIGGLVGFNEGSISQCYSTGSVVGNGSVGGLCGTMGRSSGTIFQSYSKGTVAGDGKLGGLVGYAYNIRNVDHCLWDIECSGQSRSAGGIGFSNDEMKVANWYALNGWSHDPAWVIADGFDTPHLAWERIPGSVIPDAAVGLDGSGNAADPYLIKGTQDLEFISRASSIWSSHIVLASDIDLSGRVFQESPIGEFSGFLDGRGHQIKKLTIQGISSLGLLGCITNNAKVKNLHLSDANAIGASHYIGLLAGENYGLITDCDSTGKAAGGNLVGGLVGRNYGSISQVFSAASVSGDWEIGGLVGSNDGSVSRSYSLGSVDGNYAGGLAGRNEGDIFICYSEGEVNAKFAAGGLVGICLGNIAQCYSAASVDGQKNVGGLVGQNHLDGSMIQSYSVGVVTGNGSVGGLVGSNGSGTIFRCLWDIETSGQTEASGQSLQVGGEGLLTAELYEYDTFVERGWDFFGESGNGLHEVWQMPENGGYPVFSLFHGHTPFPLAGEGTARSPYQISTAKELAAISYYGQRAFYALSSDIDLQGITWSIAPIRSFGGKFNGQDHVIVNLTVKGGEDVGLFSWIHNSATITSLGISDANVTGTGRNIGILSGKNQGVVTNCYTTGVVSGYADIGCLVGDNRGSLSQCYSLGSASGEWVVGGLIGRHHGTIAKCYSNGSVSGTYFVGGLVAHNNGTIGHSYSLGSVSGDSKVGGLVGQNNQAVLNSYSATSVTGSQDIGSLIGKTSRGAVRNSFWDRGRSGIVMSAGGLGKTTQVLQHPATYFGWGDGVWTLLAGRDYPRLAWEAKPGDPLVDLRPYGGTGEPNDPYVILSSEELRAIGWLAADWDKVFSLAADIDLSDSDLVDWQPIGTLGFPFVGQFYGNGHSIENLNSYYPRANYMGLFGSIKSKPDNAIGLGGIVKDLAIVDANVVGYDITGILAGINEGAITNCQVTGSVVGHYAVGGLVGWNRGSVKSSSADVKVDANRHYGTLIGYTGEDYPIAQGF